jgi:tetratricopeptide (TPR) repeat protein
MTGLDQTAQSLAGIRLVLLGRPAAMNFQEFRREVTARGLKLVSSSEEPADWIVIGEKSLFSVEENELQKLAEEIARKQRGPHAEILWESEFWRRLGLLEQSPGVRSLYTPGLIARLVNVPVSVIRQWQRRGLLVPTQTVCRLAYFDYQAVIRAKNLAELAKAGVSVRRILGRWRDLAQQSPFLREAMERWPLVVRWQQAFFRYGDKLVDPTGQFHFDFSETIAEGCLPGTGIISLEKSLAHSFATGGSSRDELLWIADVCEETNRLADAIEVYRFILATGGPQAEVCFRLADVLYRAGDLSGARERYFMTLELDPEYLEAYLNLGSVLVELGDRELAMAAYEGALRLHPDFPDAHFLLAQLLEEMGRHQEAEKHWQRFLDLVPDGPWCELARSHLALKKENQPH